MDVLIQSESCSGEGLPDCTSKGKTHSVHAIFFRKSWEFDAARVVQGLDPILRLIKIIRLLQHGDVVKARHLWKGTGPMAARVH